MLQLLYLDVSKLDQVLHPSSPPSAASSRCVLLPAPASESEALHPSPSCRLVARVVRALHGARENRVQHADVWTSER
jgi:hypothetical protein